MCYERRRAEACVDESAHHALVNAGGREVDPQCCCLGSCQSDFALQAVVECRALVNAGCVFYYCGGMCVKKNIAGSIGI